MEYYVAVKKKIFLSFMTTWMDLETTTLSDVSQSEKDKYFMISLICEQNTLMSKRGAEAQRHEQTDCCKGVGGLT